LVKILCYMTIVAC